MNYSFLPDLLALTILIVILLLLRSVILRDGRISGFWVCSSLWSKR